MPEPTIEPMTDGLARAVSLLEDHERKYQRSALRWKWGFRSLLIASAALSGLAAIATKLSFLQGPVNADIASISAAVAGVITTAIAALDFESNWKVNRRSRHEVAILRLEAAKSSADVNALLNSLQQVVRHRSDELSRSD